MYIIAILITCILSVEVKLKMESQPKDIRKINGRAEFDCMNILKQRIGI